ncbi:hypothetical protein AAT70_26200, partial [Salmonella enterica]|nr:hypothetical protein [Salmonella enterica]
DCAPPSQLPRFKERQLLEPSKKPPAKAVFSFTEQEITTTNQGSQGDHVLIVMRYLSFRHKKTPD